MKLKNLLLTIFVIFLSLVSKAQQALQVLSPPKNSNYSKPIPKKVVKKIVKPDTTTKKQIINTKTALIELVACDYTIQLNSFKSKDTIDHYQLNIFFKLSKNLDKDTSLQIKVFPDKGNKNNLITIDTASKFIINFTKSDLNPIQDTILTKSVNINLKQTSIIKQNQTLSFQIASYKDLHLIRLLPYQTIDKLIPDGKAEIVDSGNLGITSSYSNGFKYSIDTLTITLRLLDSTYDPLHNQIVFNFLDPSLNKNFKIIDSPITITQLQWKSSFKTTKQSKDGKPPHGDLLIPLHIQTKNLNDTLFEGIKHLDVILKGQTHFHKGTQRIDLSIKDNPFWVELGTNFDLLDNIKSNNFYVGIYMFDKDVTKFCNNKTQNNISFAAGVFESQAVSTNSSASSGFVYRNSDSIIRNTGVVQANSAIKTIGINFAPLLRITSGKTDANGFHWFFNFLYTELLWQTINTNFTYSKTSESILDNTKFDISKYPFKESSKSYDFRSHYFGLGFPLYIKEDNYNLYVNDVIGFTSQKYFIFNYKSNQESTIDPTSRNYINDLTFATPNTLWSPFVLLQFRLNEVSYGITFSGEIRELLLQNAKPVITLALSKKFNLDQVLKPVISKL